MKCPITNDMFLKNYDLGTNLKNSQLHILVHFKVCLHMIIENYLSTAIKDLNHEELAFYIAFDRSEVSFIKRMSYFIQQKLDNTYIIRNEYTNDKFDIKRADLVVINRNNENVIESHLEVKWLFSHHLFKKEAWEYKEVKHNHHYYIKKDFNKLLSTKYINIEKLFLILITHPHNTELPNYWADNTYHKNCFKNASITFEAVKSNFQERMTQIVHSDEGYSNSLNRQSLNRQFSIQCLPLDRPLRTVDGIDVNLLFTILKFS